MKFFVDSADAGKVKDLYEIGVISGVTTNPSLVAKTGRSYVELLKEMASFIKIDSISAEVVAVDFDTMMKEATLLCDIADNITIKLPITMDGLRACHALSKQNVTTNLTLCFSVQQALLAANAGATYVSPFIGRLDDIGSHGIELIRDIRQAFDMSDDIHTKILAASIRSQQHIVDASLAGADIATIPPSVIEKMSKHPLTDQGLETFLADWATTKQTLIV